MGFYSNQLVSINLKVLLKDLMIHGTESGAEIVQLHCVKSVVSGAGAGAGAGVPVLSTGPAGR